MLQIKCGGDATPLISGGVRQDGAQVYGCTGLMQRRESALDERGTSGALHLTHHRDRTPGDSSRMTTQPATTPTEELPKDVADLAAAVAHLPAEFRSQLEPLMFRVVDSTKRRRRILNLVQEALSQLRLDMKYLVFDLEATRRERDALRHNGEDDQLREDE